MTVKRWVLLALGVLIPVALGVVSVALDSGAVAAVGEEGKNMFAELKPWHLLVALPVGYAVGVTQVVPGLSATAILMTIGWFKALMGTVSLTFWRANPSVFVLYAALGIGFLLGIFTFSKFLTVIFRRARHTAYSLIVGLSLGSVVAMFYNPDIFKVYTDWAANGVSALDLALGLALFAVGVVGAYLLVRYQRKKDLEAREGGNDATMSAMNEKAAGETEEE